MGRLANRLLRYFKECWSEYQPITPQFDDDIDDTSQYRDNPLKRRLNDSTSTTITRDKNNNTRPRKNYRQLAGLSDEDEDDEAEYVPMPSSKRVSYLLVLSRKCKIYPFLLGSSIDFVRTNIYYD